MTAKKSGQLWLSMGEDNMESMLGFKSAKEHYILLETREHNYPKREGEELWYVFSLDRNKVVDWWESSMSRDILVADVSEEEP